MIENIEYIHLICNYINTIFSLRDNSWRFLTMCTCPSPNLEKIRWFVDLSAYANYYVNIQKYFSLQYLVLNKSPLHYISISKSININAWKWKFLSRTFFAETTHPRSRIFPMKECITEQVLAYSWFYLFTRVTLNACIR